MDIEYKGQIPKIYKRDFNGLEEDFTKEISKFIPEWKPFGEHEAGPGAGAALAKIFLHMLEDIILRLNRVPEKHFAAFLDTIGITRRPPRAAIAPVTFFLSEGTGEHVLIPAKTQVAAGDIIFETEKNILAAPAKLTALYSVKPGPDNVFHHSIDFDGENTFEIFDGESLQEHSLYLGNKDLLDITGPSTITVNLEEDNKNSIAEPWNLSWQYFGEDGAGKKDWHPLVLVPGQQNSFAFKDDAGKIDAHEVNGIKSRWIRCLVNTGKIDRMKDTEIDTVQVSTVPPAAGTSPDMAFYNDVPLDMNDSEGFYPFGKNPRLNDTFYIACREAFSKKSAQVILTIAGGLEIPGTASGTPSVKPLLSWEYWNGNGWLDIPGLIDNTKEFTFDSIQSPQTVTFSCPDDSQSTRINGQENYWIRVRLVGGDYGKEFVVDSNNQLTLGTVTPPKITSLSIDYSFTSPCDLEHVLIYNNLEYKDVTGLEKFRPFQELDDDYRSLYLGFDKKMEKGPISIFFSIREADPETGKKDIPKIQWYYSNDGNQWQVLETIDNTHGFTAGGTVEFLVPPGFANTRVFGKELYWLKAVDAENKIPVSLAVRGIYVNTVCAVQGESIEDENLGSGDGSAGQTFRFINRPVMDEAVWVDETGTLTSEEKEMIIKECGHDFISEIKDDAGKVTGIWVRWLPKDDFMDSSPADRHYVMDRAAGTITFGSGLRGKVPPMGKDNIKASYRTGGGTQGNVARHEISELKTALAFVDGVTNQHPAEGGADTEHMQDVFERGPRVIKHRNRAVSEEDFERLAREASSFIARSKCLVRSGRLNIIVIPQGEQDAPTPSPALLKTVETYILQRCLNTVLPRSIRILPPDYTPVDVTAVVVPVSIDMAVPLEKEVLNRLKQFLHPLNGGPAKKGWEFGRDVHISDVFAMLESIEGVDHVEELRLNGNMGDLKVDNLKIACSGFHQITMKLGGR